MYLIVQIFELNINVLFIFVKITLSRIGSRENLLPSIGTFFFPNY